MALLNLVFPAIYPIKLGLKTETFLDALAVAKRMVAQTLFDAEGLYGLGRILEGVPASDRPEPPAGTQIRKWLEDWAWAGRVCAHNCTSLAGFLQMSVTRTNHHFHDLLGTFANPLSQEGTSHPRLENINLDTNITSAAGGYSLADHVYEFLLKSSLPPGGKLTCPPQGGESGKFFMEGARRYDLFARPVGLATSITLLQDARRFLEREHKLTQNDLMPPEFGSVQLHPTHFSNGVNCGGHAGRSPFSSNGKVCISAGHVYFTAETRTIDLLFAVSAAAELATPNSDIEKETKLEEIRQLRLEEIEANRLCDAQNQEGYFSSGDCFNAITRNNTFSVSACPRP